MQPISDLHALLGYNIIIDYSDSDDRFRRPLVVSIQLADRGGLGFHRVFIDEQEIDFSPGSVGSEYFRHPWLVVLDASLDRESPGVVIHDREDERGG
jgi:hypothetical protein